MSQRRHFQRMRYQSNFKTSSANPEDRETDAIKGDRTFLHQVTAFVRANFEGVQARIALRLNRDNSPDTVDMAGHQMAAEELVGRQAALEVYPIAGFEFAENRAAQGFRRHVHCDTAARLA